MPGSELVVWQDDRAGCRLPPRRRGGDRARWPAVRVDGRLLRQRAGVTAAHELPGQDPAHRHGRERANRQPLLRRCRPEPRPCLGAGAAQPVPHLLRRGHRPPLHRRRRQQQHDDLDRRSEHRCGRRQLRLARLRGNLRHRRHDEPVVHLPARRTGLIHHRRLRVPRYAVPGGVPRQLLLRRLRAELDPGPSPQR